MRKKNWRKYRYCSNEWCDYKELRGTKKGYFINGKFVCPKCYFEYLLGRYLELRQKGYEKPAK
jgi:hypothetical protein